MLLRKHYVVSTLRRRPDDTTVAPRSLLAVRLDQCSPVENSIKCSQFRMVYQVLFPFSSFFNPLRSPSFSKMFKLSLATVVALASIVSASPLQARDDLVLHNGQNITFDYSDSIVPASNLFGLGLLRTGADLPAKVTSDGWEGPVVLNLDDMDEIPATYVLQYPFFQNGSSYTAQIFQYDTTTLEVVVPNVHNTTFIWVNQPGKDV
ncbi:hypothetical protein C8F04DRAFT_1229854 [Mycena alexandri]|uniref:Uncharacterized protein n=1 Tax=Mycena alexandri TaxID=1745969 RepID=A0AAD6XAF0_9AGAR|nr:hypothetical protein C8F04DRAFT_1229854 [Mycena alexandri]